jgi:2-dehydropantoate 2-reductase
LKRQWADPSTETDKITTTNHEKRKNPSMNTHSSQIKSVCVYGVGGVGGYIGGKMAHTIHNTPDVTHKIYFIARGEHLDVIQRKGIEVVTPEKTMTGVPTLATDDINKIPSPDLYLLCVKSYDLDEAVASITPKVHERTLIMPLLNGADIHDRIRARLDTGIVLPACVYVGTHIETPGVIRQSGGDGVILSGKDPKFPRFTPEPVIGFFKEMGIHFQWNENPFPAIWEKYVFIAAFGLTTAWSGKTLGQIMEDDESKAMVQSIMMEILAIAQSKGIRLPKNIIEASISKANNFPFDTKTSYQRDVETKGHVNEGDIYGGTIIRMGEALGISTPATKTIYAQIQ